MRAFLNVVTALSIANADNECWWYTWLASRDRFNSDIFSLFIDQENKPTRIRIKRLPLLRAIAAALEGWFIARVNPVAPIERVDVLLIAPSDAATLARKDKPYHDTYFGPLMGYLRTAGEYPLLVGIPVATRRATVKALAKSGEIPAQSIFHTLRAGDIVVAAWRALNAGFNSVDVRLLDGRSALPHIELEFQRAKCDIFFGLIIEKATRRLLRIHQAARVIHTYENNPWEHAIDRAAHTDKVRRDVTGYLHCAVLPSHLKNYKAKEEAGLRPEPDRIICTGPAARDVFLSLGSHDSARVFPGCALREQDITTTAPRNAPPKRISTVLAVLEGSLSMTELIRFLAMAAACLKGRRILLCPHPVMPLKVLLPAAGIVLKRGGVLGESRASGLQEAIAEADAVVYQSSTAVMTALATGVPIIKVRLPATLEDDPLFACDALKQVVDAPEMMELAFNHFETMAQGTYEIERDRARAYLMDYLTPADEITVGNFLSPKRIQEPGT